MSIDRSLRMKASLARHRNVLSRAERIQVLKDQERWTAESEALGLPKIGHRKIKAGKKKAEKAEGDAAATPAAGAAAPAAGGKPTAAPAAGGKPAAAPAAKGAGKSGK
ncbi:MAG: small basic protein [Phycisphaerae bacterium]